MMAFLSVRQRLFVLKYNQLIVYKGINDDKKAKKKNEKCVNSYLDFVHKG